MVKIFNNIIQRRYKLLSDFEVVHSFLTDVYNSKTLNSFLLPQFFEYAHTHPAFEHKLTHRMGLWEDSSKLVGVACFEMSVGEAFLSTRKGYEYLLPEMLRYAEIELSSIKDGKNNLCVWITDKEQDKQQL